MVDSKKTGTTTLGIVCKDGVVLAADKRASLGHLAYDRVDKILQITDDIALTTAGSVADAQVLAKFLKSRMELYKLNKDLNPTIDAATSLLSNILYGGSKNFFPYMTMFIIAGKAEDGWKMFSLDPSGSALTNTFIATGSGMELAIGVLESGYKKGLTLEEGKKLAIKAITSAVRRDVYTGEGIDIAVIDKAGYRKVDYKKFKDIVRDE